MNGTEDHHAKQSKPASEGQRLHVFPLMWKLDTKDQCVYKNPHILINTYAYVHTL
jgi:hypothetical protein